MHVTAPQMMMHSSVFKQELIFSYYGNRVKRQVALCAIWL